MGIIWISSFHANGNYVKHFGMEKMKMCRELLGFGYVLEYVYSPI